MSEPLDIDRDPALWRRWRTATAGAAGEAGPAPDPLLVAAYAEGRLSEIAAERVEAWLVSNPARLEDVQAARLLRRSGAGLPMSEAVLARAMALVDGPDVKVLPFRRPTPRAPSWKIAAAWGSMAASLLVTCWLGFALGSDA